MENELPSTLIRSPIYHH